MAATACILYSALRGGGLLRVQLREHSVRRYCIGCYASLQLRCGTEHSVRAACCGCSCGSMCSTNTLYVPASSIHCTYSTMYHVVYPMRQ